MRATEKKPREDGAVERTEAATEREQESPKEREEQIQTKQRGTSRTRKIGARKDAY